MTGARIGRGRALMALPARAFRRFVFRRETHIGFSGPLPADPPVLRWPHGITARSREARDLAALHPDLARHAAAYRENLGNGLECVAAFADGQVVAVTWFARDEKLDFARLRFHFAAHQLYTFSLEVVPAFRGTGLAATLQQRAWENYRDAGFTTVVRLVSLDNIAALKMNQRMGFRPCGRTRYVYHVLGRRLYHEVSHAADRYDAVLPPS